MPVLIDKLLLDKCQVNGTLLSIHFSKKKLKQNRTFTYYFFSFVS